MVLSRNIRDRRRYTWLVLVETGMAMFCFGNRIRKYVGIGSIVGIGKGGLRRRLLSLGVLR